MSEIRIINVNDSKWDDIVKSFIDYDIYYLKGYVKGFMINGDGEPILIYYNSNEMKAMYVAMKRDIACSKFFDSYLQNNTYYDLISPYGYGGFIFEGNTSRDNINDFRSSFIKLMLENNIVSDFVRYHPLLSSSYLLRDIFPIVDLGKTISIDLSSKDIIWSNMTSKNRNMIRKAEKAGVEIKSSEDWGIFIEFIRLYNLTMDRDQAEDYYYFKEEFYKSIFNDLKGNFKIFYAIYNGEIISASIILFCNKYIHYHLSGSNPNFRSLAPTNLLLYNVACWGADNGFGYFHLGGGLGSAEDNLFKFKASFNRNSRNQFSIGKTILNKEIYDELVCLRVKDNPMFDISKKFFPLYRV